MQETKSLEGRAGDLLRERNFCVISTQRADGTVLAAPVWVDTDGQHVVVNTAEGRAWPAALRRARRATCTITNHQNPYEYVSITARLAEDTHDGADEHIDTMAKKYLDQEAYPFRQPGEERIIFRLRPERVTYRPGG